MSSPTSTKPYMLRAMHEWCTDNGFTPYLVVKVDADTRVPMGYVKDGEIVLNINYSATRDLQMGNDDVTFSARFNGVSTAIYIPIRAVHGIFARENGQGLFFEAEESVGRAGEPESADSKPTPEAKKPSLHIVK